MSVKLTALTNGVRVVTDALPHVETAALGVWVAAGSRHETLQNNGVAHFLEHMAFKGTSHRSAYEIARAVEAVGGYLNAYTGREMTCYYARVLKQDVGLVIDILADLLQYSLFDPSEIFKEREVILQELNQSHETPDDIVFDYFQEAAFPHQSMGRPVLGSEKTVKSMRRESLLQFMSQHYKPSQIVFSAAGNIDHEAIVDRLEASLVALPEEGACLQEAALYKGGERKEDRDLEQLHLVLGFESVPCGHPDFYASSLYSTILGGGMSSRLFQEVREKRGLVYSIYSFCSAYRDAGLMGVYAGTGKKDVQELVHVLTNELHKSTYTLTAQELDQSKTQLKASSLMSLESMSYRAKSLAHQVFSLGKPLATKELVKKIDDVTLDQVHRYAEKALKTPLTLAAVGPLKNLKSASDIQVHPAS